MKNYGGAVIYDEKNKTRSLGHIKKGNQHIIILEKINEGKKPTRQIIDTLHFYAQSDNIYTDLIECDDSNNPESRLIFGFYFYEEEKEIFEDIKFGYTVDLESDKLKEIETIGIRCYNIGYGL